MTDSNRAPAAVSRDDWAAQIAALDGTPTRSRKTPISIDRIVAASFDIVAAEGFDALTMRRVAAALGTGPASLYAHVRNKARLDDLLIAVLCSRVRLPTPDSGRWSIQFIDVCRQLRDQYLRFPGISRATLAAAPTSLETLRISEGMLAILLAGEVSPQAAAWAVDAALLYVAAYSLEASLRRDPATDTDGRILDRTERIERFRMLPAARFPNVVAYAPELTAGDGHERFDFTLDLLLRGLASREQRDTPEVIDSAIIDPSGHERSTP
ncbi:MAG TPA: TetR/AcrR family transcriptional regulator [Lacisediminihabitans sp.]|uniref:TetR/AcrR family transcriptional regulator n=1 Tax=Lacisediminihabitans sp. TaxID=2787631 RepID=UPI002ED8DE29